MDANPSWQHGHKLHLIIDEPCEAERRLWHEVKGSDSARNMGEIWGCWGEDDEFLLGVRFADDPQDLKDWFENVKRFGNKFL